MKRRSLVTVLSVVVMTVSMSTTALAGTWKLGNGNNQERWWYDNDNGSYANSGWQWIDGNNDGIAECYYFDNDGWLYTSTTTPDGYSVNENGAWTTDGHVETQTAVVDSQNDSVASQTTEEYNGEYKLVKFVSLDGTTYTGDSLYFTYHSMNLRVTNYNENSLTITYYQEGNEAEFSYLFEKNGEHYENQDGATGLVAKVKFDADGTLVLFDDLIGYDYYQK
ncbi:hypothetical protein [Clostridium transplantifaecale]|uniref:hypothetical protein n=1 Tax=Clostridium transplantifaecale TaxID=2479838 RepID=UPI000F63C2A1|nr:hypothetical protein [Clostridium transplantifaecale]